MTDELKDSAPAPIPASELDDHENPRVDVYLHQRTGKFLRPEADVEAKLLVSAHQECLQGLTQASTFIPVTLDDYYNRL